MSYMVKGAFSRDHRDYSRMLKLFCMRLQLLILRNYFLNIISFKIYDVNTVLLWIKKRNAVLADEHSLGNFIGFFFAVQQFGKLEGKWNRGRRASGSNDVSIYDNIFICSDIRSC